MAISVISGPSFSAARPQPIYLLLFFTFLRIERTDDLRSLKEARTKDLCSVALLEKSDLALLREKEVNKSLAHVLLLSLELL